MTRGIGKFFLSCLDSNTRVLVTGGGSRNSTILQVISDIFNAPVFTQVTFTNEAFLGK